MRVRYRCQLYWRWFETVVQNVANLPTNLVVQSPTVQAEESKQTSLRGNSFCTLMRDLAPDQIPRDREIWASPDVFIEEQGRPRVLVGDAANQGKRHPCRPDERHVLQATA